MLEVNLLQADRGMSSVSEHALVNLVEHELPWMDQLNCPSSTARNKTLSSHLADKWIAKFVSKPSVMLLVPDFALYNPRN